MTPPSPARRPRWPHALFLVLFALWSGAACRSSEAASRANLSSTPRALPASAAPLPSSAPQAISSRPAPGSSVTTESVASASGLPASSTEAAASARPSSGCPPEMARVAGFCMDRYEAHLAIPSQDGKAVAHPHYERPSKGTVYRAVSEPAAFPQAYINRPEAASACQQAGKRLCSVSEWYRACIGPRNWPFPYGVSEQRGVCNTKKPHLLTRLFGNDPHEWKYDEHFNNPELNQLAGFLAKAGEYEGCVSPEGVHDLVGNLHEWVSDSVDPSLAEKLPLLDNIHNKLLRNRGHGIFMGGFFSTGSEHGRGCSFVTIGHEPKYHDYSTGFRCCRNVAL